MAQEQLKHTHDITLYATNGGNHLLKITLKKNGSNLRPEGGKKKNPNEDS